MEENAPNKFWRGESHRLLLVATLTIVLVAKSHVSIIHVDQTGIGDGDTVGVAPDVVQDPFGSGERRFGVDDPLSVPRGGQVSDKGRPIVERFQRREELERPSSNAASSAVKNRRRNSRDSTRTGKKKPRGHETQRVPSGERPPPGTTQWRCG